MIILQITSSGRSRMYSRKNIEPRIERCKVTTLAADSAHLSLEKSQLKLRKRHDQNFPLAGNPLQDKYLIKKSGTNS